MKSIFKKIILIILIITTILNTTVIIYLINLYNKTNILDFSKLYPKTNLILYDKDNKEIANLSDIYSEYAHYEEIPRDLINALLCIEDSRFFSHKGVDFKALIRSIFVNLKNQSYTQGASTITQQLVKNLFLSNEKTIERKLKEAILALKLEKILTKEDILASYLSNVLYGGRIYGVKMASKYYFNKELNELNITDCAFLAGIIQMPNYYNPFKNTVDAESRRNIVLNKMYEDNLITYKTYKEAINTPLIKQLNKGEINEDLTLYSSYIDYSLEEIKSLYDINPYNNDLKIQLNVDSKIQTLVSEIMQNKYNHFPDEYLKCGIVVIENKDVKIRAIGGSRFEGLKNLNYATDVLNQVASTIKPILSYAPAIEYLNYMPQTQILDEPFKYQNGVSVKNWDNRFLGYISLRYALSDSRNITAIKLYNEVGWDNAWAFANNLGIINRDNSYYEAMAIGGFSTGYSVLEMTNAYTAFANMGKYKKASSINSIKDYDIKETEFNQVMSSETAFLINDILHDVLSDTKYDVKSVYLSSKTGQSNYDQKTREKYNIPSNATKDSWVIAYTKDYTVGIWCGYDDLNNGYYLTTKNRDIPINIMNFIFDNLDLDYSLYTKPNTLELKRVEIKNGLIYEAGKTNYIKDYFYKGYTPIARDLIDLDKF